MPTLRPVSALPSSEEAEGLPSSLPPPDDPASTLLRRGLLEGDEAAFDRVVRLLEPQLIDTALRLVRSRDDAEDIVQETWIAALGSIHRFEGRSTLRTWLFRILFYQAQSMLRGRRHTTPLSDLHRLQDRLPAFPLLQQTPLRPDEAFAISEGKRAIERELDRMPSTQRRVLWLHDLRGMPPSEIQKELGVSDVNQRVLLHRARGRLRRALAA